MAVFDEQSRQKLHAYLLECFDDDNAADLEAFAQNFLHNGPLWDRIADHFPNATAISLRSVMTEAYAAWQKSRSSVH
jgi:hypothetical protein